jgi:hypothetical protein
MRQNRPTEYVVAVTEKGDLRATNPAPRHFAYAGKRCHGGQCGGQQSTAIRVVRFCVYAWVAAEDFRYRTQL